MESSLQSKFLKFIKNQKMNFEHQADTIKIVLNQKFNVLVKFEDRLVIKLEYLEKNNLNSLSRLNSKFFNFCLPNFFNWKVRERVVTPADVLVNISFCVNKFKESTDIEGKNTKGLNPNSWHIKVNRQIYLEMTGHQPGNYFEEFFLLICEENAKKYCEAEKLYRVQCFFKPKNSQFNLICEENVDFYTIPLGKYIFYMDKQIYALKTKTTLSKTSSYSNSSSRYDD